MQVLFWARCLVTDQICGMQIWGRHIRDEGEEDGIEGEVRHEGEKDEIEGEARYEGKEDGFDGEACSEGKDNGKHGCLLSILNKARLWGRKMKAR